MMEGGGAGRAGGTRAFSGKKEAAMDESEAEAVSVVRVDLVKKLLL